MTYKQRENYKQGRLSGIGGRARRLTCVVGYGTALVSKDNLTFRVSHRKRFCCGRVH